MIQAEPPHVNVLGCFDVPVRTGNAGNGKTEFEPALLLSVDITCVTHIALHGGTL